eukprot:GFKZ01006932.1.p1 GENE.GFKZ01006932.1~~GFKZ01006932.1.p1  ORF type:complete len:138 (-),score=4.73 GFKZ01006932.1:269-682(-)
MLPRSVVLTTLLLTLIPLTHSTILSSPEPQVDPLVGPTLYVVYARTGIRAMELSDGSTVCPKNFPAGFTIMCVAPSASSASFFVDGIFVRTEYKIPYFIAGDYKGRINPWVDYPDTGTIMCRLRDGSSVSATVSFTC